MVQTFRMCLVAELVCKNNICYDLCVCSLSHVWLCDPMDCSPPDFSVHGIFQARTLEWVAISCSRGSFQLRDWTQVSSIAGRVSTIWATREALSLASPALAGDSFYHCATWEALCYVTHNHIYIYDCFHIIRQLLINGIKHFSQNEQKKETKNI